jgi:D-alanyl-D-alanine carboxypeptidase/D-alanyl-D-alanine-endopeptidase (penicillin-binding protein 4)
VLIGIVAALLAAPAAAAPATRAPRPGSLAADLDAIVDRRTFEAAFWGIEVRDLADGRVLYARDAGKSMMPASVNKLFATAAALDAYGPEARFLTSVESAAPLDAQGRLAGDLYLVGRGDPGLGDVGEDGREGLDALADALVASGVRTVAGRLVGLDAAFTGERRGPAWEWGDLVWCYGAEASGLSWNGSCADVVVSPGPTPGAPVEVTRRPDSSYYDVVSTATTSAPGAEADLRLVRELGSSRIEVSGTYPSRAGARVLSVALENPALYATTVFGERLAARGVRVEGGVSAGSGPPPEGARVLAARRSEPMAQILERTNKPSDNLKAETLLRLLGLQVHGEGSLEAGVAGVGEFLQRSGIDASAASFEDGSGLSLTDLVTPHQIVDLLAAMDRHRYAKSFRDSLAVAGRDGTLEHRMRGTRAEGRLIGKTGTRRHVAAIAGYVDVAPGRRLAFAVVLNHHTLSTREATAALDAICERLARP